MIGETICRACGSSNLLNYLPLGDHPAANAYVRPEHLGRPDIRYPLNTHACLDCALIQVRDPLPADYYVDYVYMPSASDTMPVHFNALAAKFKNELAHGKPGLIVDIGSNDGLLLAACKEEGFTVLGVDPSENISAIARGRGIDVYRDYFTAETAKDVLAKHGLAQIIVSTNTVNHIDQLDGFMAGVATVLAEDGTLVLEVPQALTCIELNEFDTVYHEHLSTFSATSIAAMGKSAGLQLFDLDELPIHGGSMRCYLRRGASPTPALTAYYEREFSAGLFKRETYEAHAGRVANIRQELMFLLTDIKAQGKTVAGYSSPAKGNTLLNYYGIGPEILPYLADRNTLKQGRYTPGMRIPVTSPERILADQPDYVLVLAWNFRDEILAQHDEYRRRGGKMIFPIPRVEIVD
jgi:SAM-dependent methyltransferase